MNQSNQPSDVAEKARGSRRALEYVLIAAMVIFVVVALGVSTSFELAAVFSTVLGALLVLAAAAARLLSRPNAKAEAQPATPRLLQPTSKNAG